MLGAALVVFALAGGGPDSGPFRWAVIAAGLVLAAWNALVLASPAHRARLAVTVDLRKQHYVQACAHATIFIWWGSHIDIPLVRDHAPLLVVQLAFAYGFDLLLSWTRRGSYTLGFGPFPIIFSTNLFLWFKADWFVFQFVMIAVGFAAKDLIRWTRDGKRVHIFNPSSLPLAVASLVLLVTSTDHLTYGPIIAGSQGDAPYMYVLLFLVSLPGQILFGVASMTLAAVLTTYLFGLAYLQVTGTYFFLDCYIPIPVFLGMHLLFTDPSTSPKTELGRLIFGAIYGLSTIALYQLFLSLDAPSFYDKLLQVPLMNLSVRAIDRAARSRWLAPLAPERLGRALAARARYVVYTGLWATTFVILSLVGGVGDRHPGQYLPFWMDACERGHERACAYLAVVDDLLCRQGSGWGCNEGAILAPQSCGGLAFEPDEAERKAMFQRGCQLGYKPACHNFARLHHGNHDFERAPPPLVELPMLLRGTRLGPVKDQRPEALYDLACEQGWPGMCDGPPPAR